MTKVLFDEGCDEVQRIGDEGNEGMSEIAAALREAGFDVASGEASPESLEGVDALILCFPTREMQPDRESLVREFIAKGGGLLATGEWGNLYGSGAVLNPLVKGYGIEFVPDRVTDADHALAKEVRFMGEVIDTKKVPQFVRVRDLHAEHPVTKGLHEIVYYAGCSLKVDSGTVLARSSASSFGDLDADRKVGFHEAMTPLPLAAAVEADHGRIVCVGDSSFLANKYITDADNKAFAMNAIKWIAKAL